MIPSNTPEDVEWDQLIDDLAAYGLSPQEIRRRIESKIWTKTPNAKKGKL